MNVINNPEQTTTRYLVGDIHEIEHAIKNASVHSLKTGGYFFDGHLHATIEKNTKEFGRLVIDWAFRDDDQKEPTPVYTVYSAVGSFPRYRRLVAVNEAKDIIRNGESSWATIVCPNGYEIHFNLHEGDVGLMLYGSNPEYKALSKALDDLQGL